MKTCGGDAALADPEKSISISPPPGSIVREEEGIGKVTLTLRVLRAAGTTTPRSVERESGAGWYGTGRRVVGYGYM